MKIQKYIQDNCLCQLSIIRKSYSIYSTYIFYMYYNNILLFAFCITGYNTENIPIYIVRYLFIYCQL